MVLARPLLVHDIARFGCESDYAWCMQRSVAVRELLLHENYTCPAGALTNASTFSAGARELCGPKTGSTGGSFSMARALAPECTEQLQGCLRAKAPSAAPAVDALYTRLPRESYEGIGQTQRYDESWFATGRNGMAGWWPDDGALPGTRTSLPHETTPCIHVLSFDRPHSLRRLLTMLNELDFGTANGRVALTITIDAPVQRAPRLKRESKRAGSSADIRAKQVLKTWNAVNRTIAVARAFTDQFRGGVASVRIRTEHAGLLGQWLGAWTPDLDPTDAHEACLILEDDLVPSRHAFRWALSALTAYRHDPLFSRAVASFGLNTAQHVHAYKFASTVPLGTLPRDTRGRPFLYRLPSSWGLVALRGPWTCFRKWYGLQKHLGRPISVSDSAGWRLMSSTWHAAKPRGRMWTGFFLQFMMDHGLFTLYANPSRPILQAEAVSTKKAAATTSPPATKWAAPFLHWLGLTTSGARRVAPTSAKRTARESLRPKPLIAASRSRSGTASLSGRRLLDTPGQSQPSWKPYMQPRTRLALGVQAWAKGRGRDAGHGGGGRVRVGCIEKAAGGGVGAQSASQGLALGSGVKISFNRTIRRPCWSSSGSMLTLMANMREVGENYGHMQGTTGIATFQLLEEDDSASTLLRAFPPLAALEVLDWDARPLKVAAHAAPRTLSESFCVDPVRALGEVSSALASVDLRGYWDSMHAHSAICTRLEARDARNDERHRAEMRANRTRDAAMRANLLHNRTRHAEMRANRARHKTRGGHTKGRPPHTGRPPQVQPGQGRTGGRAFLASVLVLVGGIVPALLVLGCIMISAPRGKGGSTSRQEPPDRLHGT
jgi:hypothetical protein